MEVKISVIIPVYNIEKYIRQCLDSLLCQTFVEFEIICINDGSTDQSMKILQEYSQKDNRISVYHQEHFNAGIARNLGIEKAQGEYLLFLDGDDFFEKDMLDRIYKKGYESQAQIILYGARQYDERTHVYKEMPSYFRKDKVKGKEMFNHYDFCDDFYSITTPAPWTKAFLKKMIIDENIRFQSLENTNDAYFTFIALSIAQKITWIDACFVNYRIGTNNNIQNNKDQYPLCFIQAYRAIYDELHRRHIYHELEKSFVKQALSSTVYCMNTTYTEKAKKKIIYALNECHYLDMHLLDYDKSFYMNQKDYMIVKGYKCIYETYKMLDKNRKIDNNYKLCQRSQVCCPKISVIIPIYNVEKYLPACIESIIHQTLKDIEIIFIIDGSQDNCKEIVENYAKHDTRITVITQRNMGLSASRNHGYREAKGKYVYFMDSDDLLDIYALEELYTFMEVNNLDTVYFDGDSFSEDIELDEYLQNLYHRKAYYPKMCQGIELFMLMRDAKEFRASVCLQMTKKQHLDKYQLKFHEGILHEDNAFSVLNMILSYRAGYVHKPYFKRRYRQDSIMTKKATFQNSYGYYMGYNDLMKYQYLYNQFSTEQQKYIYQMISRVLTNGRDIYAKLDDAQKMSYLALNMEERHNFYILVASYGYVKDELIIRQNKLQQTYDEKYERGVIINELRREITSITQENRQIKKENQLLHKKIDKMNPLKWIHFIKERFKR